MSPFRIVASLENSPVIEKLFALIDGDAGFAGLASAVGQVESLDGDDAKATRQMTAAILSDAALTAQLMRQANASGRAGESVSTVDKALAILGINKVKSLARSLDVIDDGARTFSKPQADQLHAEMVAAAFCGNFAAALTRTNAARLKVQESQVCGLVQSLGRLLACYYLYDDIARSHALQAEQNLSEDDAVTRTLGVSFTDIGAAVAKRWKYPDVLQKTLESSREKVPSRPIASTLEWHQYCGRFARAVTDILFRQPEHQTKGNIASEIYLYRNMLHLKENDVAEMVDSVFKELEESLAEDSALCTPARARDILRKSSERVTDWLSPQDSLTKSSGKDVRKTRVEVIYQILRSVHDEFQFDMTLLCIPNGTSELVAISGVGRNANQIISRFRCSGAKQDVFRSVAAKSIGLYVGDVLDGPYAKFIPDWYGPLVGARSLYVMSLMQNGEPLGIVYGDFMERREVAPDGLDGDKMQQWRGALITALKPAGGKA